MRIPQLPRLPDDGAPDGALECITDVQEATFHALAYTARERPARSGISIGHAAITAGTLGGLVRDRETGAVAILSNNHGLANYNTGTAADAIPQLRPAQGGHSHGDTIATLDSRLEHDTCERERVEN